MKKILPILLVIILGIFVASFANATPYDTDDVQAALDSANLSGIDATKFIGPIQGWDYTYASTQASLTFYNEGEDGVIFGIRSLDGSKSAVIFGSNNTPVARATVFMDDDSTIVVQTYDANNIALNVSQYQFIDGAFDFYFEYEDIVYPTRTAENVLVYQADEGSYVFVADLDENLNFTIIQAESVKPVPEPATMTLLGFGLIAMASITRKRFVKRQ